jgi:general secretion pathway protein D
MPALRLPATGSTNPDKAAQVTQLSLGTQVRVVADEHNNALLIHAPRREYRSIESALRRLDVAPTQVLIEASIVEITLNDELKYGLQWYFNNSIGGGRTGGGLLNGRESGDIGPEQPGFSYTITNSAGMVRAVLNALATKSLVNVISTPSIMVQDNHTATIHVGDQQPVRSSETVTDGGRTTTSIQYKDTGVMLSVTPSANAGGMIGLDVHQSVTDVGQVDVATSQRSFLQRQLSSRVAVRSGETVVLGGLIRDNQTRGRQGVPVLHDLPLLGNLFGATTVNTDRTELLVMITPRVLQREADHRGVLAEMRSRMHGLRGLLERGAEAGKRDLPTVVDTD